MPVWRWFAIAVGSGLLVGLETWAWLRHGTSAIALAATGAFLLFQGLMLAMIAGVIALAILAGITGWDPAGINASDGANAAKSTGNNCDANYPNVCLDADAYDYDCDGGSGDGPEYVSVPVDVPGDDPFGLDRDGDGTGCD
jgi:hypothetical protein